MMVPRESEAPDRGGRGDGEETSAEGQVRHHLQLRGERREEAPLRQARRQGPPGQVRGDGGRVVSRFAKLPRPAFARRAGPEEKEPAGKVSKGLARRAALLQEADAVL